MKEYKVVPAPGRVVVKMKDSNMAEAFNTFADILAQEAIGGWEYVSCIPVSVVNKKQVMKDIEEPYNALVFEREI